MLESSSPWKFTLLDVYLVDDWKLWAFPTGFTHLCCTVAKQCDFESTSNHPPDLNFWHYQPSEAALQSVTEVSSKLRACWSCHQEHMFLAVMRHDSVTNDVHPGLNTPKGEGYPYPRANGQSEDAVPPGGTLPQECFLYSSTWCTSTRIGC